jgi:excisionase family DNA binding protein
MVNETNQFLSTVKEVTLLLRVSEPTVFKLVKEGKLQPRKIGRRTFFVTQEVKDYVLGSLPEVAA